MKYLLIAFAAFSTVINNVSAYTDAALADQVQSLPGSETLDTVPTMFSGYLDIPGKDGTLTKHMHYWFVESDNSPSEDPIGFWTNGGPGCSGLLGFLTEQGPFQPNADMTLRTNKYAWTRVSNMVFIESPAGVGFSYTDNTDDLTTGDEQTAIDNYNLIQAFFEKFPEYKSNALYISSESYGGHYMPQLAKKIVDENTAATNTVLNFKGFAVGNPYTNVYSGDGAMLDTYWGHQLVPKPTWDKYQKLCVNKESGKQDTSSLQCLQLSTQIESGIGNLNPYALDFPVCTKGSSSSNRGKAQRLWFKNQLLESQVESLTTSKSSAEKLKNELRTAKGLTSTADYEPCEEDYTSKYLNDKSVKEALHVKTDIRWGECSYTLKYNNSDMAVNTAPIYNYLVDGGYDLNILVYSGDDDGVCATIGTQDWIWDLGYTIADNAWSLYTVDQQTAGYFTTWKNTKLGFLTIHGAGHEVPAYKPAVALDMWTKYLQGDFTKKV